MPRIINLANFEQFVAVNSLGTDLGQIPGPVVIPSCAQITLRWSMASGKIGHNVLYGRYVGGFAGTQAQANAIMTALTTGAAWTALALTIANTTSLTGVDIRNVAVADQPILSSSNAAVPGTNASGAMPNEVAAVLTKRTANVGRANRGRIYLLGFGTDQIAFGSNTMVAPLVTALTNWGGIIAGALSGSGYTHVLGQRARAAYTSPVTGRQFPARAANSINVTSVTCIDNHWDSQRRRGLK